MAVVEPLWVEVTQRRGDMGGTAVALENQAAARDNGLEVHTHTRAGGSHSIVSRWGEGCSFFKIHKNIKDMHIKYIRMVAFVGTKKLSMGIQCERDHIQNKDAANGLQTEENM